MFLVDRLVRGTVSGLIATLPMTASIYAGKGLGRFVQPPPREVTGRAAHHAHVQQHLSFGTFQLSWLAAHFGFGAAAGFIYGLVEPVLPPSPVVAGLGYGTAVWALFYLKILPDLGLYPQPDKDRRSRTVTMIVAHFVFGMATAFLFRRLAGHAALVVKPAQALPEVADQ